MNGDELRDRRQGDPARETARRYNLVNAVVREHIARRSVNDGFPGALDFDPCDIPMVNTTTNTVALYGVLGVDSPLIDTSVSTDKFQTAEPGFNGVTPVVPDSVGAFGIAQQPVAPNAIGLFRFSGVTRCQVNITSTNHTAADIMAGDTTQLTSGDFGGATILWASGTSGTQWAYVRVGGGGRLPNAQYPGQGLISRADHSWSAAWLPCTESNQST